MLGLMELCARNVSAAIREALNAQVAAKQTIEAARTVEGHPVVSESVIQKISEARLLLEIAQEELAQKR
jgi:ribosome-binding protein aMBF1 (putative translation factor)